MHPLENEERTFVPATPENHRLVHRKSWLSFAIDVVVATAAALVLAFLVIL